MDFRVRSGLGTLHDSAADLAESVGKAHPADFPEFCEDSFGSAADYYSDFTPLRPLALRLILHNNRYGRVSQKISTVNLYPEAIVSLGSRSKKFDIFKEFNSLNSLSTN